jgi:hypothetical protein
MAQLLTGGFDEGEVGARTVEIVGVSQIHNDRIVELKALQVVRVDAKIPRLDGTIRQMSSGSESGFDGVVSKVVSVLERAIVLFIDLMHVVLWINPDEPRSAQAFRAVVEDREVQSQNRRGSRSRLIETSKRFAKQLVRTPVVPLTPDRAVRSRLARRTRLRGRRIANAASSVRHVVGHGLRKLSAASQRQRSPSTTILATP